MKQKRVATALLVAAAALLAAFLYVKSSWKETVPLTADDVGSYEIYKLSLPAEQFANGADVISFLLKDSQMVKTQVDGETDLTSYTSGSIPEHLPMCSEIVDVGTVNDCLYISYSTKDDQDVILCYDRTGFCTMTIYNTEQDECISISDDQAVKYTNFRHGRFGNYAT